VEILALHPGALGDIILSLPALSLLKQKLLGSRLTLAGNLDHLAIVPPACSDRRLSIASLPLQRLYGSLPLPEADVRFWNSFDRIISWTGFADPRFAANLRAIHPDAVIAPWRPCPAERRHVSSIFADSLSPWVSPQDAVRFVELRPDTASLTFAHGWYRERGCASGTPIIALQPGAGSPAKRWPLRYFAQVALGLQPHRPGRFLIVEGPAEPGLGGELAAAIPDSQTVVAECLPLERLAAILSLCRAYVGNDSGISHLAAAIGIPSVVVFGPTSRSHWAPRGPSVTVLRNNSGCAACAGPGSEEHRCLHSISPQDVLRVLASW